MEVPTIYKAYIKQGILEFPLTKARCLSLFCIEYSLCWTKTLQTTGTSQWPSFHQTSILAYGGSPKKIERYHEHRINFSLSFFAVG